MSAGWLSIKFLLDNYKNISTYYIDEEGSEILIESECEFEEALRVAKLKQGNQLKIVFKVDKLKESTANERQVIENMIDKSAEKKKPKMDLKVVCSQCSKEPEWFTQYMKKFKKEIKQELKSDVYEYVKKKLEEHKSSEEKKDDSVLSDKKSMGVVIEKPKKKKRKSHDKGTDLLMEHREAILLKKIEKLHATKSEKPISKLEKLDNKALFEEKRKLLEKKRHIKSRLEKKHSDPYDKILKPYKSGSFSQSELRMKVQPGASFKFYVEITNDGCVPWCVPKLHCFACFGFNLDKTYYSLPGLKPGEQCRVKLKGTMTEQPGFYRLNCKLLDGIESLGRQLICWVEVESEEEPKTEDISNPFLATIMNKINENENKRRSKGEEVPGCFIKDAITSSQKKIEENILEIEKKLRDIELVRSCYDSDLSVEKTSKDDLSQKTGSCSADFLTGCDFNEKNDEETPIVKLCDRQGQEEPKSGGEKADFRLDSNNYLISPTTSTPGNLVPEKKSKRDESEYNTDSELSIIYMSEEEEDFDDEDFIVIPNQLKTPSPGEEVTEDKILTDEPLNPILSDNRSDSVTAIEEFLSGRGPTCKDKHVEEDKDDAEVFQTPKSGEYTQATWIQSNPTSLEDETVEREPKRAKYGNSEYRFSASDLTHPTFTVRPETQNGGADPFPTFTFANSVGEEKEAERETEAKTETPLGPFGNVVFEVDYKGCCHVKNPQKNGRGHGSGKHNRGFEESPGVNILPNAFVNGAANVASMAISTAKSVINSLQSAFVTEGKTELGKPACEQKNANPVSMEAMFKLYEMGFTDLQLNRRLLVLHFNELSKAIDDLIALQKRRASENQQ